MDLLSTSTPIQGVSALPEASVSLWIAAVTFFVAALILDQYWNRKNEVKPLRASILQTLFFVAGGLSIGLYLWLFTGFGSAGAVQYTASLVTEWSLSVDNIFVMALIMKNFAVPREIQHRALFVGVLGAIVFRVSFILFGAFIMERFAWVTIIAGAYLLWVSYKTFKGGEEDDVTQGWLYRLLSRSIRTTGRFEADRFFVRVDGQLYATLLCMCAVVIMFTDAIFAIDSVPAVLSNTPSHFIAVVSNSMAVLGLRNMYFLYSYFEDKVAHLGKGVSVILLFVGTKLIIGNELLMRLVLGLFDAKREVHIWLFGASSEVSETAGIHFSAAAGLSFIVLVLSASVIASLIWPGDKEEPIVAVDEPDAVHVEVFASVAGTMRGEWGQTGQEVSLMRRYIDRAIHALREIDSDGKIPTYAFAESVEKIADLTGNQLTDERFMLIDLGNEANLAALLGYIESKALATTGKFVAVIAMDGRLANDQAELEARRVFVTLPDNAFILFLRISDEPGGAQTLQGFDDFNIRADGTVDELIADRCDTIHCTNDAGEPLENIGEVICRELCGWLDRQQPAST
jgi:tellurite resistance protein TerC